MNYENRFKINQILKEKKIQYKSNIEVLNYKKKK